MMLVMRTTVDIPEGLLRRVRAQAALDGRKMKDVVNEALRRHLGLAENGTDAAPELPARVGIERAGRFVVPVVRSARPGEAVIALEKLKELEDDEQRHGEIFGR